MIGYAIFSKVFIVVSYTRLLQHDPEVQNVDHCHPVSEMIFTSFAASYGRFPDSAFLPFFFARLVLTLLGLLPLHFL